MLGPVIVEGAGPGDSGSFSVEVTATELPNPIQNFSFETGDYSGWTLLQNEIDPNYTIMDVLPAGAVSSGTPYFDYFDGASYTSGSVALPFSVAPTEGTLVAVWLSHGPANRRMYQDVVVTSSTLTWDMAHWNSDGNWAAGQQYIAINVRDPGTDAILATPFTANALPAVVATMTPYSADLSAFVGQLVRIDVEVQGQNFFLDAAFDNFVIQ